MQLKSRILIVLSILTLLALIAIQSYLIYNSYELKQKTITIDARNAIAKVYNTPQIDSISWIYRNDFLANLELYKNNSLSKSELLSRLNDTYKNINPGFLKLYNQGLKELDEDLDVRFKKMVTGITLTDSLGNTEIIYPSVKTDTITLLGEDFNINDGLLINNSTWQKDHEITTDDGVATFDLNFKSSIYMNVSNWNSLIIRELSLLLILSCVLFFFVVGLLYYSIQNLLKQKRVAEIKTDFINNITHELKTPLSTLSLATKTFSSEYAKGNNEVVSNTVEIIERQNTRLQKLIDQVLMSSLGYKQIQLEKESFNVTLFLNNLLDDFALTIPSEVTLDRNIDNTGINMQADPFYISTAIINILNNAIKYGGVVLNVSYSLDTKEQLHLITISDNGIGIEPKYQRFIFEKFYRISERDTHNYKGLGLGLYYTSQIIKAHSGNITVNSAVNKGATFIIKLPITA